MDLEPRWDLSYLGTYSPDRQPTLERLLVEPARQAPHLKFAVAGPLYPDDIAWPANVERIDHVPPADHARFYASSRFTLNVTRADMIRAGYSPSVRLFEAAAAATPIVSDAWPGLETIFVPGREIVVADRSAAVLEVLTGWSETERRRLGERSAASASSPIIRQPIAPASSKPTSRGFARVTRRRKSSAKRSAQPPNKHRLIAGWGTKISSNQCKAENVGHLRSFLSYIAPVAGA